MKKVALFNIAVFYQKKLMGFWGGFYDRVARMGNGRPVRIAWSCEAITSVYNRYVASNTIR